MTNVTELLDMPLADRADAEAFISKLHELGLGYHFDDGAVDCLHGNNLVSLADAHEIDDRMGRVWECWRASGADLRHDCPIGYLLELEAA